MDIPALFEERNLRHTRVREAVLGFLYRLGRPLTHGQISEEIEGLALDRVTLCRALASLEKAGLVHRVQGMDGPGASAPTHLGRGDVPVAMSTSSSVRCGELRCLLDQPMPWVQVPGGTEVPGKQLVVYCVCCSCKEAVLGEGEE